MIVFQRVLIFVAFVIALVMMIPTTSPLFGSSLFPTAEAPSEPEVVRALRPQEPTVGEAKELPPRVKAKGLLMTGYTAGGARFETLLGLIRRTELNSVVIDIKDEAGEISWITTTKGASIAGAGRNKIADPKDRIRQLKRAGVYVIGRVVTFQDPQLSTARPDLAVRYVDGSPWTTDKGLGWVDPYSVQSQQYALDVAREAVALGFDEIQFDYVRFPSDGEVSRIWYPHRDGRPETEVIRSFLRLARQTLRPLGVYVSADLFGLVTLADDDMGIGQRLELIAPEVDYVSLMLYPSHYESGNYGISDPESNPYDTISVSIKDAKQRIAGSGAILRPWVQDFSLRVYYSPREVRAQIRALEDEGVDEWLLWNARNRYSEDALKPAEVSSQSSGD